MEQYNGVIGIVYQRGNPNRYLLIYNQKTKNVTLPAGGKEEGEVTSEQTLKREIQEETGLTPGEYTITKTPIVHEFIYNSKKEDRAGQSARQLVFLLETAKNNLVPEDSDALIAGWYTKKEVLEKLTFPDAKEIFQEAIKYL